MVEILLWAFLMGEWQGSFHHSSSLMTSFSRAEHQPANISFFRTSDGQRQWLGQRMHHLKSQGQVNILEGQVVLVGNYHSTLHGRLAGTGVQIALKRDGDRLVGVGMGEDNRPFTIILTKVNK